MKGTVVDSAGAPVPYCSMVLLNAKDSSIVKGNVTDEKGEFNYQSLAEGNYLLKFTNIGFGTGWSKPFSVDSTTQLTLEPQVLRAEGVVLKEVAVAAFRPTVEFKNGTVVLNIENNIISGGNTVFELLKRVPGVTIDAQNNISVNGRGGVRFLFDGRLQQIPTGQIINLLMSMPAESVSYIELIKNPPAKYDAAGTGGLINIVMKRAKVKGFSGSLSQSGSHGDQWRGGTFGSLNFKSDKLTLFVNFNVSYLHFETNNYFYRSINNGTSTFEASSQGRQDPLKLMLFTNGGIEYEFSKKTTAGLNFNTTNANTTIQENSLISIKNGNIFPYDYIKFNIATTQQISNPGLNINLTHKFDTLTRLQFMADYTNYLEDNSRYTTNRYFSNSNNEVMPSDKFGSNIHNNFNIYTQKLDFTRDFKKQFSIESGFKSSFVSNASNSQIFLTNTSGALALDSGYSNNYKYQERILAGYFIVNKHYKRVDFKAGVRTEHTLANGNNKPKTFTLHRDYINFFPSGSADIKFNEKNSIQATYTYRIGRPSYDQMSPSRVFNDRFSNGAGNPQLKPEYSHVINMDYNFNNLITLSASYQRTNNSIYYYSYGDTKTKINIDSIFNFQHVNNASLSLFMQKQVKKLNFNFYLSGIYQNTATLVNGLAVTRQAYMGYGNFNVEYMLPKDVKIQLQGFYASTARDGIQTYNPIGVANFTIFRSFFNKKLDVSFSIFDLFYSDRRPYTNQVGGQYTYYLERNDTRRLRGFIVWKFGKMRVNQNTNKSNDEERNRLKKIG